VLRDENKDGDGDCVDGADQRLYYAQDANFNVTALVNTSGTVVERVLYDAYGKSTLYNAAWSSTQASTLYNNEVLYSGYRLDPESGLYQVRYRQYHPTLGRWLQRDPIGYHDGFNLYEYVKGRPMLFTDVMGLTGCCCIAKKVTFQLVDFLTFGHKITATFELEYRAIKEGEVAKDCEFEWWERWSYVFEGRSPVAGTWEEERGKKKKDKVEIEWNTQFNKKKPCPGPYQLKIKDDPVLGMVTGDRTRILSFAAVAKSSCPEGGNVVGQATQILDMQNRAIVWDNSHFLPGGSTTYEDWIEENKASMPGKGK
jgi:RHS repeat-associated protein